MALPTLDELKDLFQEEYDCRWEPLSEMDPVSGKVLHGGVLHRAVDGDDLEAPYLADEIGGNVPAHVIKRLCKDLDIPHEEV